jgi:Protein of unknown function (DUF2815)
MNETATAYLAGASQAKKPSLFILDGDGGPQNFVRLSYLHCYDYQVFTNDKGEQTKNWSVSVIVPPSHPAIAKAVAMMKAAAIATWKDKGLEVYTQLKTQDRLCIHDGATKPGDGPYAGNWHFTCNSKVRPTVIGPDRAPLVVADGIPQSGDYGNVEIEIWAQNRTDSAGKRLNAGLMGIQFWRKGESLGGGGGRVSEANEFPVAGAADDDAPTQAASGKDPLE